MVPEKTIQQKYGFTFTRWPNEMFGQFKASTCYVWLALRSHGWKTDGARPSVATIMAQTGLSESTVKRAIHDLVAAKVLTVTKRGDASPNLYAFPTATDAKGTFTKFENGWWTLGLNARQAMTLLAIQHFKTLEAGAVPGRRQLARMTMISEIRVLREVIPSLVGIGVVEVIQRSTGNKRRSNSYRIVPVDEIVSEAIWRQLNENYPETDPFEGSVLNPHGSEMNPLEGSVLDPHGSEMNPLMVPTRTPKKTNTKKTDPRKTENRNTDSTSPRLRRAEVEEPMRPELWVGQEAVGVPGSLASRMARYKSPSTPGAEKDIETIDAPKLSVVPDMPTTEKKPAPRPLDDLVNRMVAERAQKAAEATETVGRASSFTERLQAVLDASRAS